MRTTTFLPIAGALGLVAVAALFAYGQRVPDAALDAIPRPLGAHDAPARESGHDASSLRAAPRDSAPASVDLADRSRSGGDRVSSGAAAPVDRTDPAFEIVRSTLADAIDAHLPGLALSANELEDLADATMRLRSAQARLRTLPVTREQADRRALERRRLEEAVADFTYLVEMTPAEFTRRVEPAGGIDEWTPDGSSGEISIRPIRVPEESE